MLSVVGCALWACLRRACCCCCRTSHRRLVDTDRGEIEGILEDDGSSADNASELSDRRFSIGSASVHSAGTPPPPPPPNKTRLRVTTTAFSVMTHPIDAAGVPGVSVPIGTHACDE